MRRGCGTVSGCSDGCFKDSQKLMHCLSTSFQLYNRDEIFDFYFYKLFV